MNKVLVIVEHDNKAIKEATLNTISAALEIDGDLDLLVAGKDCMAVAKMAAAINGVAKVLVADAAVYEHQLAENVALLIAELGLRYTHILMSSTAEGKNILPRAAALLDVQPLSDVISIESDNTFKRGIYAGSIIATLQNDEAIKMLSIRSTSFASASSGDATALIETLSSVHDAGVSTFMGEELSKSARPELTSASIVISGGRGMQNGDNFSLLYDVADKLGAAVGASRAAVDAGYVTNDLQVGQTGKIVAPDLYLAVGISGAIQHLAGMKDSKVIVAINKDADAPIFQIADYGLVADLFEAMPEFEALV